MDTKYITEKEVEELLRACRSSRYPLRNELLLLMTYRHGLRREEAVRMQWSDLNLDNSTVMVRRVKGSESGLHPLTGRELRLLRKYRKSKVGKYSVSGEGYLFISERGSPLTANYLNQLLLRLCRDNDLPQYHPHQLRHGCGYYLINKGVPLRVIQSYLGHKNIQNTVRYTAIDAKLYRNLFD